MPTPPLDDRRPPPAGQAELLTLWPPLRSCSAETRARLFAAIVPRQVSAGERVLCAGDPPDQIVLLREGVVRVFHAHGPGVEFTVKLVRAPCAMGLVEVLTGSPWAASIEALVPCAGAGLPAEDLRAALEKDPQLVRAVLADLAWKFEGTILANRHLGFDACETRVLRVLLEYADHFGRPVPAGLEVRFALSRERLAREVGAARRSIDRALADLKKEGLVELSPKGWLVLLDREKARSRVEKG